MVDFTKLEVGVAAPAKVETAFTVEMPQFKNGNGKPLEFTALSFNSPEGMKELRKLQLRFARLEGDHYAATEADLDRLAPMAEERDLDMIARIIRGWNVEEKGGAAVECSIENRRAFLSAFPDVQAAFTVKLAEAVAEMGKQKPI